MSLWLCLRVGDVGVSRDWNCEVHGMDSSRVRGSGVGPSYIEIDAARP